MAGVLHISLESVIGLLVVSNGTFCHAQATGMSAPVLLTDPGVEAHLHRVGNLKLDTLESLNRAGDKAGLAFATFFVQRYSRW